MLICTSGVHYNPSLEQYAEDKIDDMDCVCTEHAYIRQINDGNIAHVKAQYTIGTKKLP